MGVAIELFTAGLALGASQCVISCIPMLTLYIAGTREGWREGLKATLIFSFSRLFAYVLLGLVAGLSGTLLTDFFQNPGFGSYLWISAGAFLSLLGVLIMLGKEPRLHLCRALSRHAVGDSTKSMVLLGFLVGVAPCAPLLGILTYVAFSAKNCLLGAFYGFCFGFGTAIITPIVVLGVLASVVPRLLFRNPRLFDIFRRSCGLLLLFFGARLIVDAMAPLV
ncbi:MAG TPA: sulfite exporter TauE/SafE family protein [Dehalococcoidia bacterium]|nr:sulfite exporter TauE/SafE family protein [Dehalococcoidia bacterium]